MHLRGESKKREETVMRKIVINKSYEPFCVSHKALLRLRELGQEQALQETDLGAYWPKAADHENRAPARVSADAATPYDSRKTVHSSY